jgi:hypothetical protein
MTSSKFRSKLLDQFRKEKKSQRKNSTKKSSWGINKDVNGMLGSFAGILDQSKSDEDDGVGGSLNNSNSSNEFW